MSVRGEGETSRGFDQLGAGGLEDDELVEKRGSSPATNIRG